MLQVTLSYSKQAITSFTQFAYTTLTWSIYSLVANNLNLFIMKATRISCVTMNYPSEGSMLIEFTDGSSLMIPKNSETDIDILKLAFGIVGRWYTANETNLSDCITEPTEEDYEYADSMFNL